MVVILSSPRSKRSKRAKQNQAAQKSFFAFGPCEKWGENNSSCTRAREQNSQRTPLPSTSLLLPHFLCGPNAKKTRFGSASTGTLATQVMWWWTEVTLF